MLRIIVLALFLTLANVVVGDDFESNESECEPRYYSYGSEFPCNGGLSTGFNCNNTFLSISKTPFYNCSNVNLFWSYPTHNLTVIIETPSYTNLNQPFTFSLSNGFNVPVYRIYPNGQEVLISNTTEERIAEISDENYQVVLKFEGPDRMISYGMFIEYQVEPIHTSIL